MSILMVNDWVTFNNLKEMLELADGTLASHIKALEAGNYLEIRKEFVGKKPQTSNEHLDALEALLKSRD
jgi:DNA-binding transcriptional ArsR family regulator